MPAERTVKKREIAKRVAQELGITATLAGEVIQRFLDEIIRELAQGNRLEFRNFGVFEPRDVKPKLGRNPRTGDVVEIPKKKTVRFKVGKIMKQSLQSLVGKEESSPPPGM